MSNADRWDHSGYNELIHEEKPNNYKKQIGNKKHFYKYKDNMGAHEKQNVSEYLDQSQMNNRKNQNKKFSNYNYNKYHNDEWNNDNEKSREFTNSELFDNQSGTNDFKGKYKKKKKGDGDFHDSNVENKSGMNEYYNKNLKNEERSRNPNQNAPHYGSNNLNYGNVRPIEQMTSNNNNPNNNNNSNNMNNPNYYGRNKNNQPYTSMNVGHGINNNMSGNFSATNSGFNNNINPNYQSNNPKNIPVNNSPFPNYNNYMSSPYNVKVSGVPSNFNSSKPNSSNQIYHVQGNLNTSNNSVINKSPSNSIDSNSICQKIVVDDRNFMPDEELIMQQSKIVNNDVYGSNQKNYSKNNQNNNYTIESTDIHNITRNSDDKTSLPNTPNRNSANTYQSNTTNTSMHINSQTPNNSVGFSPKNTTDPIYMNNMMKMPNNYNFNSPVMHENFMYPNYPNTRNPINMNNMNGPYYGMINGMNPMNMNAMEPNSFQGMQNNFNPNMNTNFGNFPFNTPPHHMGMMPQMKGPMVNQNNMNLNQPNIQHGNKAMPPVEIFKHNGNVGIHNEELYNTDPRSGSKKLSNSNLNNNNVQVARGINTNVANTNTSNQNNFNPFERSSAGGNVYNNTNPITKKGIQPYNNNFINNNINISNLNYNQMNANNKNFNTRKINNNFNPNMNNVNQNPLQRMKFVKSDKNLMANFQNQNSFKMQQNTQENQIENKENNINPKSSNNKIWRDSKGNNSANIDTLTSIINNTIKGSVSSNPPLNKNNSMTYTNFTSIKEEHQQTDSLNKNKKSSNFPTKEVNKSNFDEKYFSSNESEYSIAEEEIICEGKDVILYVSVRISGKDELLGINSKEDSQTTIRKFITKHHLNEKLLKPISEKVNNALSSIDSVLKTDVESKHYHSLKKVKNYYTTKIEENDTEKLSDLDLSCFTEIGDCDTNCETTFHLTNEESKTTEKLNMSR